MARVVEDPMARAHIEAAIVRFQATVIGPLVTADAIRYAPKRTGEMAHQIHFAMEGTTVNVVSPAPYSADVELGHRIFHPETGEDGPDEVVEEPFLRPALYKHRSPTDPEGTPPLTAPAVPHPGISYPTLSAWEAAHGLR